MLSLNQQIKAANDFATAHGQINTFGTGEVYDLAASGVTTYPLMWMDYESPSITTTEHGMGVFKSAVRFYFLDRLLKGALNLNEVLSDIQLTIIDFVAYLQSTSYFTQTNTILDTGTINLTPVMESFHDDEIAGYYIDVTFKSSYEGNTCQIPQSGLSSFPVNGGGIVNIIDQNGAIIAQVSAGSSYSILSFNTISGGASNTTYTNSVISS